MDFTALHLERLDVLLDGVTAARYQKVLDRQLGACLDILEGSPDRMLEILRWEVVAGHVTRQRGGGVGGYGGGGGPGAGPGPSVGGAPSVGQPTTAVVGVGMGASSVATYICVEDDDKKLETRCMCATEVYVIQFLNVEYSFHKW